MELQRNLRETADDLPRARETTDDLPRARETTDDLPRPRAAIDDPLLSPRDICDALGVSRATLYRYVRNGSFPQPSIKFPAGRQTQAYRWRKSVVEAYLSSLEAAPDVPDDH